MKTRLLSLLLILFAFLALDASRPESRKLWIFFKDRPYLKSTRMPAPQAIGFTQAAIDRRALRGSEAWDESDMPVDPSYLKVIRAAGGEIVRESRWLNAVSVRCTNDCFVRLSTQPFIQSIRGVAV